MRLPIDLNELMRLFSFSNQRQLRLHYVGLAIGCFGLVKNLKQSFFERISIRFLHIMRLIGLIKPGLGILLFIFLGNYMFEKHGASCAFPIGIPILPSSWYYKPTPEESVVLGLILVKVWPQLHN